jgi:hypothetical protein
MGPYPGVEFNIIEGQERMFPSMHLLSKEYIDHSSRKIMHATQSKIFNSTSYMQN